MTAQSKPVSRYTTAARINHWITAVSLILLALSGLALFHPSLYFLTYLFGGGQLTRAIHPWIGVVLAISFLGLFFRFFTLNLWNRDDTAVVHALCAIGAILIWIVHVYAAIWVKGTISAMTRGKVSGGWAWKHHRKWFRQEVGKP